MKYALFSMLLFPLFLNAQDCNLHKTTDDFTHETRLSTGFMTIGSGAGKILLSIDATKPEIDFFFSMNNSSGNKCFDDNSTVAVIFEGTRSKANYRNTGSMNCEGLFHFIFRNSTTTQSALQRFSTSKVVSFLFTGSDKKTTEVKLDADQQQLLMQMTSCIITQSKTLLQ
jgi:hypothetical protein